MQSERVEEICSFAKAQGHCFTERGRTGGGDCGLKFHPHSHYTKWIIVPAEAETRGVSAFGDTTVSSYHRQYYISSLPGSFSSGSHCKYCLLEQLCIWHVCSSWARLSSAATQAGDALRGMTQTVKAVIKLFFFPSCFLRGFSFCLYWHVRQFASQLSVELLFSLIEHFWKITQHRKCK